MPTDTPPEADLNPHFEPVRFPKLRRRPARRTSTFRMAYLPDQEQAS
ncbi:hypothetical protein [Novosphingobium terrae]|nr:hypothetical protein [Novosphingobium terrae]